MITKPTTAPNNLVVAVARRRVERLERELVEAKVRLQELLGESDD